MASQMRNWDETILDMIPEGAFEAVNLKEYKQLVDRKYEKLFQYPDGTNRSADLADVYHCHREVSRKRLAAMTERTFFASMYLPCHHDSSKQPTISGNKIEAVIAHPHVDNIDVLTIQEIPKLTNNKHLSLRRMKTAYKLVKKVQHVRRFHRPDSVFADWQVDTKKNMDKAFDLDA